MFSFVAPRPSKEQFRTFGFVAFGLLLMLAVWLQRSTIADALGELRSLPIAVVVLLVVLGVTERLVRTDIFRTLLGNPSYGCALTVHETGTAASKGIPMGGPISTALRWTIARDSSIPTTTFAVALIATGVASTFVTWTLPLAALGLDLTQRPVEMTDLAVLAVCSVVLVGSVAFWAIVLGSDRVHGWSTHHCQRLCARLASRIPAAEELDPATGLDQVRAGLRSVAIRPWGLLARSTIAQICSAVVLLVALRAVGVGPELDTVEFLRVFFIVTLLGSFIPTPGGVGVIEAGLTGALVASGVEPSMALAGVLVYRLITYVMPIALGAILYVAWRGRVRARTALASLPDQPGELELMPSAA